MKKVAPTLYTLSSVRWISGEKSLCSAGSPVWYAVRTERDDVGWGGRLGKEGLYV